MPIADWTVPFSLTSAVYSATLLPFNEAFSFSAGSGIYLLREDACSLNTDVRSTKDNVPQADGSILHCRYLTGMEMNLTVQLWENQANPACDQLQQEMMDTLMGYLYGLLNAGDNQGRISWTPNGGSSATSTQRMLDDIRLLTYPVETHTGVLAELAFTVDCALPYAEDLTQLAPSIPGTVVNAGNRPTYPVWQIYSGNFILTNTTTGDTFAFDDSQPGCPDVGAGYVEIDTFRNTAYLNGNLANLKPGIVMDSSDFFSIPPGTHTITCPGVGGASRGLINPAWA